jgi:hypothetical protein
MARLGRHRALKCIMVVYNQIRNFSLNTRSIQERLVFVAQLVRALVSYVDMIGGKLP